jgi:mono/diheme cytochrome c family protein
VVTSAQPDEKHTLLMRTRDSVLADGSRHAASGRLLSDDKIAAVLTYTRNTWGNAAWPITSGDVQTLRASLATRTD